MNTEKGFFKKQWKSSNSVFSFIKTVTLISELLCALHVVSFFNTGLCLNNSQPLQAFHTGAQRSQNLKLSSQRGLGTVPNTNPSWFAQQTNKEGGTTAGDRKSSILYFMHQSWPMRRNAHRYPVHTCVFVPQPHQRLWSEPTLLC